MVSSTMPLRLVVAAAIAGLLALLAPLPAEAQSAQEAQLTLRLQQLEDQVRTLTGQVEGLQFQLAQMQTLIQKMSDDYDYRLKQIEEGRGAAPAANPPPAAAPAPPAVPPKADQGAAPQVETHGGITAPVLGPDEQPMDDIGGSQDPLVGTGSDAPGVELGTLPAGSLDINGNPGAAAPASGVNSGTQATADDAEAQYTAGYDAITKGDYRFAEEQFQQFLELYPDNAHAPDAAIYLGQALIQRQAYDEAAEALIDAYQKYRDTPQAPEVLLKLGVALNGAGERDTACRTYSEIGKRYTDLSADFKTRLGQEQAKAQCPPA